MRRPLILVAALLLALTGCAATAAHPGQASDATARAELLAAHDLDGMNGKQIVDHLDRLPITDRPAGLMASVRSGEVLLTDAEREVAVPLGEAGFYLSVAPYVDQTHDCYYHSLTTCRGELANEEIGVRIVGAAGEVLIDERVTTFDNGFAGFWLPRDVQGTIEVTFEGRVAVSDFSTSADGATCLTTLRLEA